MALLYPKEHISCFNYQKTKSSLESFSYPAGYVFERVMIETEIVFVTRGSFRHSHGKVIEKKIAEGDMILIPPGRKVRMEVDEDTEGFVCRVNAILRLCDCFPLENLFTGKNIEKEGLRALRINNEIAGFLEYFAARVSDGLRCIYYFETKIKELFFLFRAYYPKEDLAAFFAPLLSKDSEFLHFIYRNYRNANSVQKLVELSNYSESGFKKQFNKVFGVPPSEWLREQKAINVFHDLNCSPIALKEICDKYDFSSVSSFNAFCQNNFGSPPGQIRRLVCRKG